MSVLSVVMHWVTANGSVDGAVDCIVAFGVVARSEKCSHLIDMLMLKVGSVAVCQGSID
jgi:hypothetical protein